MPDIAADPFPEVADVSVVIPVRNGAEHLSAAIGSVLAQPEVLEVVVVDDGSTDATPGVAGAFADRVRYVRQEAAGAAAARNRGVALATGALVAFLDADDLWLPGKLARQRPVLVSGAADMVFARVEEFVSPELDAAERASLRPRGVLDGVSVVTMLLRRADFLAVGAFDEDVRTGEFLQWYGRAREAGLRGAVVPELLARRRLHRGNHGRSGASDRADYARVLHGMLARRRAAAAWSGA